MVIGEFRITGRVSWAGKPLRPEYRNLQITSLRHTEVP